MQLCNYRQHGQALLWLSLSIILLIQLFQKDNHLYVLFGLSLTCFLMYGVKLPYTFFILGIAYLCWLKKPKYCYSLLLLLCAYYLVETYILYVLSNGQLILGRLQSLLIGGQHIKEMDSHRINSELYGLIDRGVFLRWSKTRGSDFAIYLFSCIVSLFVVNQFVKEFKNKLLSSKDLFIFICSVLFINFFVLTTFFIISIDPIKVGQPLRSRYLALLLPIGFILVAYGCNLIYHKIDFKLLKFVFVVWILVLAMPNIHRMSDGWKRGVRISSLDKVNAYYFKITAKKCIRSIYPRYLNSATEVYSYWEDETVQRLKAEQVKHADGNRGYYYVPEVCSDAFKF